MPSNEHRWCEIKLKMHLLRDKIVMFDTYAASAGSGEVKDWIVRLDV